MGMPIQHVIILALDAVEKDNIALYKSCVHVLEFCISRFKFRSKLGHSSVAFELYLRWKDICEVLMKADLDLFELLQTSGRFEAERMAYRRWF